jgi:hypothetical protein
MPDERLGYDADFDPDRAENRKVQFPVNEAYDPPDSSEPLMDQLDRPDDSARMAHEHGVCRQRVTPSARHRAGPASPGAAPPQSPMDTAHTPMVTLRPGPE